MMCYYFVQFLLQIMRRLVYKCLKECNNRGLTSVAFPALGAGNLSFPNDTVAKLMVEEIVKYFSTHKNSSIATVHLVIYMDDTHKAFQQELATRRAQSTYHTTQGAFFTPTSDVEERSSRRGFSSRKLSTTPQASHGQSFVFDKLNVHIYVGDITNDISDAVVNSTNKTLQLSGPGVSGALLKKGGKELQRLCDEYILKENELSEGEVLSTKATGHLRCKFVFHAEFNTNNPEAFIQTIEACLKKAEKLKCSSIAFPAVGTGAYSYPPQEAASGMVDAIRRFSSAKPKHILSVNLVLFQSELLQDFVTAFQNPASMFKRAGVWVQSKVESFLSALSSTTTDSEVVSLVPESIPFTDEEMYRELEVNIYGESRESVTKAEEDIHKLINDRFTTKKVDTPFIDQIPESEVTKLKRRGRELQVEIDIDRAPLNRIRLKGTKDDVSELELELHQLLAKVERELTKKETTKVSAEQLCKLIQWKWIDNQGDSIDYDVEENYEIEQAYRNKQPVYTRRTSSEHFMIDFSKEVERDILNRTTAKVQRVDLERLYREGNLYIP